MRWTEEAEKAPGEFEPGGVYPFEIADAEERTSKAGNDYINVKLQVFIEDSQRTLYVNLMPQMAGLLKSWCLAMGLEDRYKNRDLSASDCRVGRGYVEIGKKPNKDGYYQAAAFHRTAPGKAKQQEPVTTATGVRKAEGPIESEDDIPF